MNIQKTDLVLLNKIRFAGEKAPQAPADEATEQSAEAGMKALSFEGMKNIMSNPALAQKVGIEGDEQTEAKNPAFKAGMKHKVATAALVLASLVGAGSLTSCKNEGDEVINKMEQSVVVDQQQTAILQALLEEIQAMRQEMKDRDAAYQQNFETVIGLMSDLYISSQQKAVSDADFQAKVLENMDVFKFLLEQQGIKADKANELLNQILNSNLSVEDKAAQLVALVTDIKTMVAKGLQYAEKAEQDRATALKYAKLTYVSTQNIENAVQQVLVSDSILIANQEQMTAKMDMLNVDMNANFYGLAQQLGIQHEELMARLEKMGYSDMEILNMTAKEIYAAIKENTKVTKEDDAKLLAALEKLGIDVNAAKDEIVAVLEKIDGHILDFMNEFKKYAKNQQKYNFMSLAYARASLNEQKVTNNMLANLNNSVDSLIVYNDGYAAKLDTLIELGKENNVDNKVIIAAIEELAAKGIDAQGWSDERIIAKLEEIRKEVKNNGDSLKALRQEQKDRHIDNKKYAEEVIALLRNTKQDTASILLALGDINQNVVEAGKNYDAALKKIQDNTYYSSYYIQKLYEAYEAEKADRAAIKVTMEALKPILQSIDGTTINIYDFLTKNRVDKADIDRVIKAIGDNTGLVINANNANKNEILAGLDEVTARQDKQQEVQEAILEKMNGLKPSSGTTTVDLTNVEKGLADILAYLKVMNQNNMNKFDDVIELEQLILDKIKPCECNCGDLKITVEEILTVIKQRKDEGIIF